ncbi:hypothetical protein LOTGIDRAFT_214357 [Lottia gigantea]|uniref:Tyrosine specific protein phosphatases domain-containing protein n=1 Tax=Lottia gigantea TaxID=225164 RepID=V4C5H3_LOTGI|nr:hypothetical protein LOTGIDRAFT_214357 [Lottia gigantea]ESO96829.1 hypothetical protein LOTGIDRAFT_214357 [Lottia gigantea]
MKIPNGWLDYKALGGIIDGTRFIAFKVPLKEGCVRRNLPPKEWFTPKSLLSQLQDQGKELGLVIDLTNTDKYYNKNDFESKSVKYEKIFTPGKVIPSSEVCQRFQDIVNEFLQTNPDSESLIGVHCTHGLNRTGYIVCRYMIDCLNQEPESAIAAFNKARGHPIERENYLNALRYGPDSDIVRNAAEEEYRRERENDSRPNNFQDRGGASQLNWRSSENSSYSRSQFDEPSRNGYRGYEDEPSGSRLDEPWRQSSYNRDSQSQYGGMNYSRGLDSYNSGYNKRQYSESGWSSYSRTRDSRPKPYNSSKYQNRGEYNGRNQSRYDDCQ